MSHPTSFNAGQSFAQELIFLGTGTSVGVPAIGCRCAVCRSPNPKNNRLRCAVLLGLPKGNLLIDTPPDLRTQLLREDVDLIHATLYTHEHTDHLLGLDDLRLFPFRLGGPMPIYCEPHVEARIRRTFDYAFFDHAETHVGSRPSLEIVPIGLEPFDLLGARVVPIRLGHGRFDVLGFRIGNVAYCTDTNYIPEASWPLLADLDILILDALRYTPHPTHFSLDEAIAVVERAKPRQAYFTHICHDFDHDAVNAQLPPGMALAYDGLRVRLS